MCREAANEEPYGGLGGAVATCPEDANTGTMVKEEDWLSVAHIIGYLYARLSLRF